MRWKLDEKAQGMVDANFWETFRELFNVMKEKYEEIEQLLKNITIN